MKHAYYLIAGLLAWTLPPAAAQNAADILAKAAAIYGNSNGITASFTLTIRSGAQQTPESTEGTIHIKGDRFTLSTPDVKTWYDGATQWTYVEHTQEVNISAPEGDELQFTNPAILLGSYQKNFTASCKGETTAPNGKAAYIIELTPKKTATLLRAELLIEKHSNLPVRIHAETKNKIINTIHIRNIQTNTNPPDSFFTFPKADYPHAEIIDLR
jgi:outer membrane lipoprotein-sorting protein